MTQSDLAQVAGNSPPKTPSGDGTALRREFKGLSRVWAAVAALAVGMIVASCSVGSQSPTGATAGSQPTTTTIAAAGGSGSAGATPLAQAVTYARCVRSHGVPNFPDPVQTPDGGYGYRTSGIDPNSSAFQGALQACRGLPSPWNSTGQQLTAAQQQAWLTWAQCVRTHGMPKFPDPTFSGTAVHDSALGSSSPLLQSAMDACRSQRPSVGGLGG
jgi:hypothetical protein